VTQRLDDLATPALLVERGRLQANLRWAAELTRDAGVHLRPHIKTHKSPDLARLQREQGIAGITTATVAEAEVFVGAGFDDVFIAYPMVGEARIGRLLALGQRARVACGVDHADQLAPLDRAAGRKGVCLEVVLEVDSGHHRCGLAPGPELVDLGREVAAREHLSLRGVYTHAGHAYTGESPEAIAGIGLAEGRIAVEAADLLRKAGQAIETVSVGSSPTLPHCAAVSGVTEVRPGNYALRDATQVALGAVTAERCALTVLATVITVHGDRCVLDAGSKVLSQDRPAPGGRPLARHGLFSDRPGWTLARLSEEHGVVLLAEGAARPAVGERVRFVPNHACVAVNLASELVLVEGDEVLEHWPVAAKGR